MMPHGNLALDRHDPPPSPDPGRPLGEVVAVSEARLSGLVHEIGERAPTVGTLVRIRGPRARVYGLVAGVRLLEAGAGEALIEVDLLGEAGDGAHGFQRGVSAHPPLGAPIFIAERDEERALFARAEASTVTIGTLHHDPTLPATLAVDSLLGRHFAVFGTTGSGKSCAIAALAAALAENHPAARIVIVDPNGEYGRCFGERAEVLDASSLHLPYWLLDFESLAAIVCSQGPDHETEAAILRAAVVEAKRAFAGDTAGALTEDTPVPYRLGDLFRWLETAMGRLERPEGTVPFLRIKARLEALRSDRRFDCVFSALKVRDELADIVARLMRIPVGGRPITVLDLSAVPRDIVAAVVGAVARLIHEFALWNRHQDGLHLLLVCEAAERFAPRTPGEGFAPTARALARIAANGRRYGVGLGLVSARPSALSRDVLAQCNTLIAMRISDEEDHGFVRSVLPDNARALAEALPALTVQEAVAVGEGVAVPMRLRFADLAPERRPTSATVAFSHAWRLDALSPEAITETIARWRRQGH